MEEKNIIKLKINKIAILVVAAIIIFVGIIILKNYNDDAEIEKEANLENNTTEIDNIEEVVDKIITEVNIVTDINSLTNPKIEDIAKNTVNEYLEKIASYEKSNIGPMPYLLYELELASKEELDALSQNVTTTEEYIKSNTSYENFKNALLQYVTEDYFVKFFSQYRNIDGYVAFCNCAGSGLWTNVEDAELISRVGNTFNFKITIKDLELYDHYLNGDEYVKEEDCYHDIEVALEYVNNRLVVSKFSSEIILEGIFYMENTDVSYEFYKDGTVEYQTNMAVNKGSYVSCQENQLEITWEEKTSWDPITAEETTSKVSGKEVVTVINNKKIRVEAEYDGETVVNEFIKK